MADINSTNQKRSGNTYILIGGGCNDGVPRDTLAKEISRQLDLKELTIYNLLFVNFGKEKEYWQSSVEKYKKTIFRELLQQEKLKILIASPNTTALIEQVQVADLIFFTGGNELLLKEKITKDLIPAQDKIIMGISAGTNLLSKYYFSNDRGRIEKGIGVLPINTICHFSPEKQENLKLLSYKNKSPTIPIEHDKFLVLLY